MASFVKVISTELDKLNRRVVKFLRNGSRDVQTADQVAPHGIDSNPVKDMIAIYADTTGKGDTVIVGYLNRNQLAGIGETRIFSTDENGVLKTYHWLKNDGTHEIGGNTDFMVRYSKLEEAFNELKNKFNTHVQNYNTHVHPGVTAGGASSAATPAVSTESAANIALAKISQIKTI
jgi:hypothetical protein